MSDCQGSLLLGSGCGYCSRCENQAIKFIKRGAPKIDLEKVDLESYAPEVDMELDLGIREAVLILRRGGVETFESCEGGAGHACPEPIIRFHGNAYEGFRAFTIAKNHGLPVLSIAYEYSESNGWLEGPHWKMTFRSLNRT